MAAPTAADVPHKYDLLLNGVGYLLADVEEVKATYGYTPTFVPRTNTQGDYGDNQQDFWLSATQRDFVLGEQQKYFRGDETSSRRYWQGTKLDVTVPGRAAIRQLTSSIAFAAAATAVCGDPATNLLYFTTSTNLYSVNSAGTISDKGAHGLGIAPTTIVMGGGTSTVYMSQGSGSAVGVREWDGAFSTFSATPVGHLAFFNNTLFGYEGAQGGNLYRYDSAGTATEIGDFKVADGTASGWAGTIVPFGPKGLLMRHYGTLGSDLWTFDTTGMSKIAEFPRGFVGSNVCVVNGFVFAGGYFAKLVGGTEVFRPAIYYYANGTIDLLWRADTYVASIAGPALTSFGNALVFSDDTTSKLMSYDTTTGGVHSIGTFAGAGTTAPQMATARSQLLMIRNSSTGYRFPNDSYESAATLTTSLYDFDSSLSKIFRGIKVEFESASDGNGGTVDIAYRVGDVDGAYTTLQTGAVSGTEYTLSNITGRAISVKVTLNKGTSTAGPVLTRVAVRAVPQQASFRRETFVINCSGRDGVHPLVLRNGEKEANDGLTLATALRTAATTANPISITDEFGTFTGVIEADGFSLRRVRPNEFIAIVPVREV
jgi:hypothetical protein